MPDRIWAGGAVGNWNVGGNWAPAGVPGPGEKADIDRAGGAIVTGDVNINCMRIDVGPTQANNILIAQHDVYCSARIKVLNGANNQLRLDGNTVGPIDVATTIIECEKADGIRFMGVVDLRGLDYNYPCVIQNTGGNFIFDANADVEFWWVIDEEHSFWTWTAGAKLRAVRGCQFLALTDNLPELHVAGTRYKFVGDWNGMDHFSGGRYSAKDRSKNLTKTDHHGARGAGVAWSGHIVDSTYKFLKDELQYWCDQGTQVVVITRDRVITGFITNFHWRPAGVGADPDAFEYDIEIVEEG